MFQCSHLFRREPPLIGILTHVVVVCTIRILHRSQVSRHRTTITRKHKTLGGYNYWLLYCASIIASGDFTLHTLSIHIVFIISIVERVPLLVRGESFRLLKAVARIMRRNGSTAFHKHVVSFHTKTIWSYKLICVSYQLFRISPRRSNRQAIFRLFLSTFCSFRFSLLLCLLLFLHSLRTDVSADFLNCLPKAYKLFSACQSCNVRCFALLKRDYTLVLSRFDFGLLQLCQVCL